MASMLTAALSFSNLALSKDVYQLTHIVNKVYELVVAGSAHEVLNQFEEAAHSLS